MPDRLVYSTDSGRVNTCPTCGQPYKQCRCDQSTTSQLVPKESDGIVRIMRDHKHRGGKTVTVISGYISYHRRYAQSAALTLSAARCSVSAKERSAGIISGKVRRDNSDERKTPCSKTGSSIQPTVGA
jgi:translation initiation factor 1 (eIF-1/SUI1)